MKHKSSIINTYITLYPNQSLENNNNTLYCRCCYSCVSSTRKFLVTQHLNGIKHCKNLQHYLDKSQLRLTPFVTIDEDKRQPNNLYNNFNLRKNFISDLCNAFSTADIPFSKLDNRELSEFLEKYTGFKTPDRTTLTKNYLLPTFNRNMEYIREKIKNKYLWASMDETTDISGNKVAVLCVGILDDSPENEIFLVNMKFLKTTNACSITQFFNQSMNILFDNNEIQYEKLRFIVTDAASYMRKACESIKGSFPDIFHMDCFAHNLHNLCNTIRLQYPDLDDYIACIKKILRKSNLRKEKFKDLNPTTPYPKYPSTTRWGSWLTCVRYLAQHNQQVINFIESLDPKQAHSIVQAQQLVQNITIQQDIQFIDTWFGNLIGIFPQLQMNGLTLRNSIRIVEKVKLIIDESPENAQTIAIKTKLEKLLVKNEGLATLMKINEKLTTGNRDWDFKFSRINLKNYMYTPITSSEVERVFSLYNNIYTNKRTNLSEENLKYMLFIKYFNKGNGRNLNK